MSGAKTRGNTDEIERNVFWRVKRKQGIGYVSETTQKHNNKTHKNNQNVLTIISKECIIQT